MSSSPARSVKVGVTTVAPSWNSPPTGRGVCSGHPGVRTATTANILQTAPPAFWWLDEGARMVVRRLLLRVGVGEARDVVSTE